jgi:uncharacterized membrane protein YbhN (UPF0104 family)
MMLLRAARRTPRCGGRTLRHFAVIAVVIALGLLALSALAAISPGELASALMAGRWEWVLLSAVLYGLAHVLSALVWREGLGAAGLGALPLASVMRAHWLGRGASELLPAQLGEAARLAAMRGQAETEGRMWRVVGSVGAFKLVDGGTSLIAAAAVLLLFAGPLGVNPSLIGMGLAVAVVLGFLAPAVWARRASLAAIVPRRVRGAGADLVGGARILACRRHLAPALGIQSFATLMRVGSLAALLVAYGGPAHAAPVVFALLVVTGLLPISPGGVGVREVALLPVLVGSFGLDLPTALAFSVATQATALAVSLLGAGIALLAGVPRASVPAPTPAPAPTPTGL